MKMILLLSFLSALCACSSIGAQPVFSFSDDWKNGFKCKHPVQTWKVTGGDACKQNCLNYAQVNASKYGYGLYCCAYEHDHGGKMGKCHVAGPGDNDGKTYNNWKKSFGYRKDQVFMLTDKCGRWVKGYDLKNKYVPQAIELDFSSSGAYDQPSEEWCQNACREYALKKNTQVDFLCKYLNSYEKKDGDWTGGLCAIANGVTSSGNLKELKGKAGTITKLTRGSRKPWKSERDCTWPSGGDAGGSGGEFSP